MNSRQLTIVGRIGVIIFIIGFAIILVSLVPNVAIGTFSSSESSNFRHEVTNYYLLSYQMGMRIEIESNYPLFVQFLNISSSEIYDWVVGQYPDIDEFMLHSKMFDTEVIEQFLVTHPGRILSNITTAGSQRIDYFPDKITNVTATIKNPLGPQGYANIRVTMISAIISEDRVFIPSITLMIIGSPPALLWIIKNKNRFQFREMQFLEKVKK